MIDLNATPIVSHETADSYTPEETQDYLNTLFAVQDDDDEGGAITAIELAEVVDIETGVVSKPEPEILVNITALDGATTSTETTMT